MKKILIILTMFIMPGVALAMVIGGSNLSFGGYPSHTCYKPSKPYRPYSFSSQWEIDSYNAQVRSYNSQLRVYLNCIDEYVENASNDIKRIKEKAQDAMDEANQ